MKTARWCSSGMKRDFNKWLASLGPAAPVKSLTELRNFNLAHTAAAAIKYGQSQLDISDEMDVEADRARYEADRAKDIALAATNGIDAALKENSLDALLFLAGTGSAIAAKPGYPTVIVPFGMVPNAPGSAGAASASKPGEPPAIVPFGTVAGASNVPFPEGFNAKPAPFGVSFTGTACSEPRLIKLAYTFAQTTRRRVPPLSAP